MARRPWRRARVRRAGGRVLAASDLLALIDLDLFQNIHGLTPPRARRWTPRSDGRACLRPRRCRSTCAHGLRHPSNSFALPATTKAAAALNKATSRNALALPLSTSSKRARIVLGVAAAQRLGLARGRPMSSGLISKVRMVPLSSAATLGRPDVVISSSPSEPCTTQTHSEPKFFSTCAIGSTQCLENVPDHLPLDACRVRQRPEQIEDGAGAELDARGANVLHRRMVRRRGT